MTVKHTEVDVSFCFIFRQLQNNTSKLSSAVLELNYGHVQTFTEENTEHKKGKYSNSCINLKLVDCYGQNMIPHPTVHIIILWPLPPVRESHLRIVCAFILIKLYWHLLQGKTQFFTFLNVGSSETEGGSIRSLIEQAAAPSC